MPGLPVFTFQNIVVAVTGLEGNLLPDALAFACMRGGVGPGFEMRGWALKAVKAGAGATQQSSNPATHHTSTQHAANGQQQARPQCRYPALSSNATRRRRDPHHAKHTPSREARAHTIAKARTNRPHLATAAAPAGVGSGTQTHAQCPGPGGRPSRDLEIEIRWLLIAKTHS